MINKTFNSYEEREEWLKEYDKECRSKGSAILMIQSEPQYVGEPTNYTVKSVSVI